jgi:hypothetical protein
MNAQFDAELSAALLGFNGEAGPYCQGISDTVAQEYAVNYARMLQNRAKGIESSLPLESRLGYLNLTAISFGPS